MLRSLQVGTALVLVCLATDVSGQQQGAVLCSQQATSPTGFTTRAQVVAPAATGSASIYVCGYTVSAVAASVVTFSTGTGSNCGTNTAAIGPTIQLGANATVIDGSATFRGFQVPNPNALCATATTAANLTVYYSLQ